MQIGSDSSDGGLRQWRVVLLYSRPEFESRLGTPEEALNRAETIRRSRVELDEYYIKKILYVCTVNVKNK